MSFDDNELERLKERLKESFEDQCSPIDILHLDLEALLARLEAAEYLAFKIQGTIEYSKALEAWRKAVGK